MKNLKLFSEISQNIQLQSNEESIHFAAYDIDQSRLFFASSTNTIYTIEASSFQNGRDWTKKAIEGQAFCIDLEDKDFITAFDYLMEKESLLMGTFDGLLLLHNVESNVTELVGNVEGGVKCISPSPSGDLLGIITGFGQLLVMTHDWDLLYERALGEVLQGEAEHYSSRSFAGISISWRGDGKYFATMGEVNESGTMCRKINVWESETGALQSSSESKAFMNGILEWMPSGAKIAVVCERKSERDSPSIVFFERNGLERSKFSIGESSDSSVETLKWNSSSDLLAGVVRCETSHDALRIWFFSNNHWYVKHEIRYPREDAVRFMWDPTKPLELIAWTLKGQVTVYKFIWKTAVMVDSTAFVIDNSKIYVTPLSLSLMPPPMFLFSLKFRSAVRDIAYYSRKSERCLAVFLSDGNLSFVEFPEPSHAWEDLEGKEINVEISGGKQSSLGSFVHLLWLDLHSLLCVSRYGLNQGNCLSSSSFEPEIQGYYVQEIEVERSEDYVPDIITCSGFETRVSFRKVLESSVIALDSNPSKLGSAFVQFAEGRVLEYSSRSGFMETDGLSLSSSCPWMHVVHVEFGGAIKPLICGLDDTGKLYINGERLCNNCSSFAFYSKLADEVITHLILSTKQDLLFILDIDDVLRGEKIELGNEKFMINGKKREGEDRNYLNIWERGAKVIGILNGDEAAVILQTIRGNLECIYPRKLVIASITIALAQRRFRDALNMVRRHRIHFNVIVDACGWKTFLELAVDFVKQADNLNHITEFVCSVKNEDVTKTLYRNFFSRNEDNDDLQIKDGCANKVSSVLQAIRKALEEHVPESPARELCILTTLARSDPPAIEESLVRIKSIREKELLNSVDSTQKSFPSAEEALKHLLWLLDSEAVFEAALGLYDLNLAAIVALNAQRDPKEFLPYLQELEKLPESLMRYNIDLKLHRFDSALRHIVAAGDDYYSDCMTLMKKNPQLFPLGLQLITDPIKVQEVLEAWGDHLIDEKHFNDAATTFLSCGNLEKTLKAYRECGDWRGVFRVAGLMKLGKDETLKLAYEVSEELNALGKPGEAAKIALEYCGDVSNGINLVISAREWEEAIRVAYLHKRDDLISVIKDASIECCSGLVSEYKEALEKIGKYLTRYLAVRQRRLSLAAKLKAEERSVCDLDDDTASEASSNLSGMSAYTFGTRKGSAASVSSIAASKAREARRQRKSGKIRAGSPGEELALVEHLKGMRVTDGAKREINSLLICLTTLGEKVWAHKLQLTVHNFQLTQMASVELADDTLSSERLDEEAYSLERYVQRRKTASALDSDAFNWMLKVFVCPSSG